MTEAITVPTGRTLQPDQAFSLLAKRHPQLSPHIRKLRAAVARGDKVRAAQLMAGLEIAVEVFEATSPVQPDMED